MGELRYTEPTGSAEEQIMMRLLKRLSLSIGIFNHIPPSQNIVFLTPYLHMPPWPSSSSSHNHHHNHNQHHRHYNHTLLPMDPFEPLGRALSLQHPNIRHAPYVAKRGIIDTHQLLIHQASGIIVVVCDSSASEGHVVDRLDSVSCQKLFAKEVGIMAVGLGLPCLLVSVGVPDLDVLRYTGLLELSGWEEICDVPRRIFGS